MKILNVKPEDIEKRSMELIEEGLNGRRWPEPEFSIIKRCIHTSADFDYADNLTFSEDAARIGIEAIRSYLYFYYLISADIEFPNDIVKHILIDLLHIVFFIRFNKFFKKQHPDRKSVV